MPATALEVWGDPIDHSLSPALHTAAYRHLGWDWTYGRRRVDEDGFAHALAGLDASYRGLSLTMPLKAVAHAAAVRRDERAELTGAVNTLRLTADGPVGFNTDVGGIVAALGEEGLGQVADARIVGAGATATSALVALAELGATRVDVAARRPEAAAGLTRLGARLGVTVQPVPLAASGHRTVPLTIATLPGGVTLPESTVDALAGAGGLLMDVVYGHWPTALSAAWERVGRAAVSGAGMLLHQAVLQIRVFATGEVTQPLPDEPSVVAVMRRALMGG
ncbi:shikimate dehydrogenase family protein [Microbacterium sp. MC2]